MHLNCTDKNTKKEQKNTNTKSLQTLAYKTNISQFTLENEFKLTALTTSNGKLF